MLRNRFFSKRRASIVEFYERFLWVFAEKGIVRESHQTPLEFAYAVGSREAILITELYNGIRFGNKELSDEQRERIENWLVSFEKEGFAK